MIDQNTYAPGGDASAISMDQYAYAYVPSNCQGSSNNCKLHVALHGCLQSSGLIGTTYVEHAGFNEWAETNNIVVVYPQAVVSVVNPQGCWDWWGYTNDHYADKGGPQIQTINNIIQSFLSQ
eukprot:TRINITY_DN22151_c0_g1_i1.p2 TRINITY_DN22151_c0_g1~~TRINITY_DN22151_c0_g1_i1.p2  ORF type:complete len:122 (+),score=27.38 TRINITY_DN22151_c0_g1_i1:718-1083(+)